MYYSVERNIGGKQILIETGKYAEQADASATVRSGDTIILATLCVAPKARPDIDFLPLTVDYEERLYAAGRIPGSFFRREGRPTQQAILFGRLIDRPIRPLLPKGFYNDIQIIITVMSVDKENPPETLGIVGASAALAMSHLPFPTPIGACRVGYSNGSYIINPTYSETDNSSLALVIASTKDAVMMVESESDEVSEETVLEGIRKGQAANLQIIEMVEELASAVGREKMVIQTSNYQQEVENSVSSFLNGRMTSVLEAGLSKVEREESLNALESEAREALADEHPADQVGAAFENILKEQMRQRILNHGIRADGRSTTEIRPISCEVGILPRTHGTGLFTRGQTQVLSVVTLGSTLMKQTLDDLGPDDTKHFMHHYNFTPYSTGEVKRVGSPGRREVGHGALAERSILQSIPPETDFPYTIRIVSEVLSSNGSTSMASVCGSTLALMDAGVPIKRPVAGVAMGLIMGSDGRNTILTDIEGLEDHLGDMDFKVAGTSQGINALQMDIKVKGITNEILERALAQAKDGRMFILAKMEEAITQPRESLSPYAPKMLRISIPVAKIGMVIGPGGRMIRSIQEETGATIDVQDDGTVTISVSDDRMMASARSKIEGLTREVMVGDIFTGKVSRVTNFGAFVELIPGKDGLARSEDLGDIAESVEVGQEITVIVQEIDHMGRVNVSRQALLGGSEAAQPGADRNNRPPAPFNRNSSPGGFRNDRRPPRPGGPSAGGGSGQSSGRRPYRGPSNR